MFFVHFGLSNKFFSLKNRKLFLETENKGKKQLLNIPLAFTISKTNFIIYNTSLYNIPSIKTSIFFNIPFKYSFFIIFFPLSLLSLSLSQPNYFQHCQPSHSPTYTTSTHHHHHQPLTKSTATTNNSTQRERERERLHIHPPPHPHPLLNQKKSTAIGPNHHQPQYEKKERNPQTMAKSNHNPQPKKTHKPNWTMTPSIHAPTCAPWLTTKLRLDINATKPKLITFSIVIQQSLTIYIVIQQRNNKKKQNPD